jgi:hypothetical protein
MPELRGFINFSKLRTQGKGNATVDTVQKGLVKLTGRLRPSTALFLLRHFLCHE